MIKRVGLDPEVAIVNADTGLARSAHQFIDGLEKFRFRNSETSVYGSEVERDGAALEVRSVIDSACRDNIIPYLAEALRQSQLKVEAAGKGNFTLSSQATYVLDDDSFEEPFPEDIVIFGCRPDIDAYSLEEKDPECDRLDRRRYTGGHIHASRVYQNKIEDIAAWAVLYDYYVATPFVAMLGERYGGGEAERRLLYGQPGSFRWDAELRKIEFRTLSGRLLLHPTYLYWAIGAMKMMMGSITDPKAQVGKLHASIPTELVYDTVLNHNVEQARLITDQVFKLLPNYKPNKALLAYSINGGGGGASTPFFYETATSVFVEAARRDVHFPDDMKWNWGLYKDYTPQHHKYWGLQAAMRTSLDDAIFPLNSVVRDVWPAEYLVDKPVYTHPTNGGAKKYTVKGAAAWLA